MVLVVFILPRSFAIDLCPVMPACYYQNVVNKIKTDTHTHAHRLHGYKIPKIVSSCWNVFGFPFPGTIPTASFTHYFDRYFLEKKVTDRKKRFPPTMLYHCPVHSIVWDLKTFASGPTSDVPSGQQRFGQKIFFP